MLLPRKYLTWYDSEVKLTFFSEKMLSMIQQNVYKVGRCCNTFFRFMP